MPSNFDKWKNGLTVEDLIVDAKFGMVVFSCRICPAANEFCNDRTVGVSTCVERFRKWAEAESEATE